MTGGPGTGEERRHGDPVWTGASGVADLRTARPMRPNDRFRAGSLTKPFVATVVLQLVAEGRLSLSDTVERWLPGILPYGDQITVRQLLNHTSGVPDNTFVEPIVELYTGNRFRSWRPRELVALIADLPPDFAAGTAWSYSNTGYALAGLIVEQVTGHRLGRELKRRIFRPLRLRDTSFPIDFPFLLGRHARGYSLEFDPERGRHRRAVARFHRLQPIAGMGGRQHRFRREGPRSLLPRPARRPAAAAGTAG